MGRRKERRRRQRIRASLPIKIKYSQQKITTRTKDISVLGVYVEADREIPIGTSLSIQINIPEKQIACKGVAFRSEATGLAKPKSQYGIGIFFRSFLKTGEKDLVNYIDYILSQEKKMGKIYMRKRRQKQLKKQKGGK